MAVFSSRKMVFNYGSNSMAISEVLPFRDFSCKKQWHVELKVNKSGKEADHVGLITR
jgi:hypothetical protein